MLSYRLLCIGKSAPGDPLRAAADDYAKRLSRYAKFEWLRLPAGGKTRERDTLLSHLRPQDHVVTLDENGTEQTTLALSRVIARWQQQSTAVAFLIGGADGLHETVRAKAHASWSLSRLTLPHRLALVVLVEQLYRAHSLLRGEPYHRA